MVHSDPFLNSTLIRLQLQRCLLKPIFYKNNLQNAHFNFSEFIAFYGFKDSWNLYLNNSHAWVKEDGSFGFFGGVFIFVEVEVVRPISKLSQMEVPSLEGLEDENRER